MKRIGLYILLLRLIFRKLSEEPFHSASFFYLKKLKTLEKLISNAICDTINLLKEDVSHELFNESFLMTFLNERIN